MSSELERLLRDAREALPGPDDAATVRARRPRHRAASHEPRPRAHPRSRRSDPRGSDRARSHRRLPHRADRHRSSRARSAWLRPRARLVRAAVTAARGAGSTDGRSCRERSVRSRRHHPRARRAVGSPVLHAPRPSAEGHRRRRVDDVGRTRRTSRRCWRTPCTRKPSSPSGFATACPTCSGEPRCDPTSRWRSPVARENRPLRRRRRRLFRRVGSDRGAARCRSTPARRACDPAGKPTRSARHRCHPKPLCGRRHRPHIRRATRRCSVACTSSRIVRMRGFVQDPDGRSSRMWSQEVGDGPPR